MRAYKRASVRTYGCRISFGDYIQRGYMSVRAYKHAGVRVSDGAGVHACRCVMVRACKRAGMREIELKRG